MEIVDASFDFDIPLHHALWCPESERNELIGGNIYGHPMRRHVLCRCCIMFCCPWIPISRWIKSTWKESHFRHRRKVRRCVPEPYRPSSGTVTLQKLRNFKSWNGARKRVSGNGAQSRSRLLQLPAEIRVMVYEMLMQTKDIHILWREGGNIGAWYVEIDEGSEWQCACGRERRIVLMNALLSCRKISTELASHLYSTTTFHFHGPQTLLYFLTSLSPTTSSLIPTIHLSLLPSYHIPVADDLGRALSYNSLQFTDEYSSLTDDYSSHNDWTRPLEFMPRSLRREYADAMALPPEIAQRYTYTSAFERRWTSVRAQPMPSLFGAVCASLARLRGLRVVVVDVEMRVFWWGPWFVSPTAEELEEKVKTMEGFLLEGLGLVKDGMGERGRVVVSADWYIEEEKARSFGVEVRAIRPGAEDE